MKAHGAILAAAEAVLGEVRARGDRAAALARSASPLLLASAEELYAGYRVALEHPESFARGSAPHASSELAERSIRAEFAVALGVSERVACRELENAALLVEHLPATRSALAEARLRWEAGQAVCAVAATLPPGSRAEFDARAADLAARSTPTQLRRALARLREELHEQPLAERHRRAREDRAVWLSPEVDGMATLCALLPAPVAVGAYARLDRIARILRDGAAGSDGAAGRAPAEGRERDATSAPVPGLDGGDERTLAQLRADALADILCDADVIGTIPDAVGADRPTPTLVPGVRAEVRLTLAASTASGLDDAPADLDGYGPIPAGTARNLLPATVTRVMTEPRTGAVLSVGRTRRLPHRELRLLLQLRDVTCRFPGCTRSASGAEADHVVEWRNGGGTDPGNLASLCVAHHHVRHGDRWTYVLHPDGTADWTTPTGRRITTRPPAREARLRSGPRPSFDDRPPPF
ncbi:HNH endonuclease [Rathayibacter rathayi]|uniref:HNH endonuclease n=1 Tax=Rathayibacter rathayi TaxID=33887 RepID=A0ABD6W5F1_RATRA|nr:HNH endonuclease signature motif containing protein [Rathayibacter rathayi]AZZ47793.1 HNH endonuclease [Rathayibacter rathayi]MWV75044.1 DUF222 domain-containing protein [Rathayibacter rathayi NCPPB 2980 = VKM Ac-1601]PPF10271.1 HNH endonuclease [Rathayibacter rathayi]PPF44309.1 HNH endonuclease [Rathayibacter rathayi]PPG65272.1 HNH endonuclease [Rathayibacter rathayi]